LSVNETTELLVLAWYIKTTLGMCVFRAETTTDSGEGGPVKGVVSDLIVSLGVV
jgi:hypothetical protein